MPISFSSSFLILRTNGDFLKSEHFQNALKQFIFLLKSGLYFIAYFFTSHIK